MEHLGWISRPPSCDVFTVSEYLISSLSSLNVYGFQELTGSWLLVDSGIDCCILLFVNSRLEWEKPGKDTTTPDHEY